MSPAIMTDDDPRLQSLARAFEGLLLTAYQLSCRENFLQQRLKYAHNEYVKLADRLGSDGHTRAVSKGIIVPQPDPRQKCVKPADAVKSIADLGHLEDQTLAAVSEGLECYQMFVPLEHTLALPTGASGREKDFTTKGTQGSLRCPFSHKSQNSNGIEDAIEANGETCGQEDLDPIKAESNERNSSGRSSSARCSATRCPIRYLDQHSPEEMAGYIERHKHELPRSHTVCVQRYQKDAKTMRHMDAKYGGTTNMIHGLGVKHQSFLPTLGQNGSQASMSNGGAEKHQSFLPLGQNGTQVSMSNGGVEKWAADVGAKSIPAIIEEEEDEERQGHFDRPLREVRVGESPSRPWGIPVPIEPDPVLAPDSPTAPVLVPNGVDADHVYTSSAVPFHDASQRVGVCPVAHGNQAKTSPEVKPFHNVSHRAGVCPVAHGNKAENSPVAEPLPNVSHQVSGCPVAHGKQEENGPEAETIRNEDKEEKPKDPIATYLEGKSGNVVFNGPVFFGYTAEQTAALMQRWGS